MKINTNFAGWLKLLGFGAAAFYLWRRSISPGAGEPKGRIDREIRFVGAILFTLIFVYFLGFGLGLWGSK
jgi:hypothetical protein